VHAGIIEPGHFRFQCHGEKVFHLEIQLGYQHRGVEKLLVTADPDRRAILTESVAGDTVIGHGLAHAHAVEGLCGRGIPQRAKGIRAIALEIERLANHIGDLGALSGDVGFMTAAAWFGRLRGEFLNLLMDLTGNRYGRGLVRPGGTMVDVAGEMADDFKQRMTRALSELSDVSDFFFSTGMVVARLEQTGVVPTDMARSLGLVGIAARASGLGRDVRSDYPTGAYRFHYVPPVRLSSGDVYARSRIRALECKGAADFILEQLGLLMPEKIFQDCGAPRPHAMVVSLVEGWRGEIAHAVMTGDRGEIIRYKVVDPSFHNWMALAMAMRDGQISDFPLCNKSFNLSYAGHDL
jgi:Ni,Fe-hydrogenase III large subunit